LLADAGGSLYDNHRFQFCQIGIDIALSFNSFNVFVNLIQGSALEYLSILAIIAALSVIQSLFGMGVLVFGTPTLLLMGYDFITILSYLLPASFAISTLQVFANRSGRAAVSRYLYLLCLPGIAIGLWLVGASPLAPWVNIMIGWALLISAATRFWAPARKFCSIMLEKHLPAYHLIMGGLHGLTNLGGALLAILASGTSTDKDVIRYTIAHYYLAFSTIQILLLATFFGQHDALLANLPSIVVAAVVYQLVGNRIFIRISNHSFDMALTVFIAAYGIVVLLKFLPLGE